MIVYQKKLSGSTTLRSLQIAVALLMASTLKAAVPDTAAMAGLARQYHDENAVYANYTERLVITYEDGELEANSYISEDKLIINSFAAANENWNYAPHSYYHKLEDINGMAYKPVSDGYKTSKEVDYSVIRPSDYVFYDDNVITVQTFTGVTAGSVLHTDYTVYHPELMLMPEFRFQRYIPTKKVTFEIVAPSWVKFNFLMKGEHTDWVKQSQHTANGNTTYTFTAENVPATKDISHVPSGAYYIPQLITSIVSYRFPDDTETKEVSSGIDKLYDFDYKYIRGLNVKEDTALATLTKSLIKEKNTDADKAKAIYKWVQENIHYIAFEQGLEGFTPRQAGEVFARRFGDCKDMTSILVAMFRMAGLKAGYAWIGTDALPYSYSEVPLPIADNHMICAVKINDEWKFADATHTGLPFGAYRDDVQGKEALVSMGSKKYKVITLPETPAIANTTMDRTDVKLAGTALLGKISITDSGYNAWNLKAALADYMTAAPQHKKNTGHSDEDLKKVINALTRRGSDKYHMDSFSYMPFNDRINRSVIKADFSIYNYIREYKKNIYVNLNLNKTFEDKYIDTEGRIAPVYLDYKKQQSETVVLHLPDTMKVVHMPGAITGIIPGLLSYSIAYSEKDGDVTMTSIFTYESRIIKPEQFGGYNALVAKLEQYYKEPVVLTAQKLKHKKSKHK